MAAIACAVALISPVLGVGSASATERDVSAFAALHLFSVKNELGQPEGLARGINDTALYGLRGTFWLWRYAGVEVEAAAGSSIMTVHQGITLSESAVTLLTGRAQLIGRVPIGSVTLLGMAGAGAMSTFPDVVTTASEDTDAFSHFGVGVEMALWQRLRLRADVRVALTGSSEEGASISLDQEATLGLAWRFGEADYAKEDSDHDGIPDDEDRCPFEAETFNDVRDDDGCPEHPTIALRYHKTRYVEEKGEVKAKLPAKKADAEQKVEPKPVAPPAPVTKTAGEKALDDLGEAAPLAEDALPPLVSAGDDDGDGIDRDDDVCPAEPEDVDGFEDGDGCPDPDNDQDGIPDDADLCPYEPETHNGVRDEDGCPEDPTQVVRYHKTRYAEPKEKGGEPVAIVPEKAQRIEKGTPLAKEATLTVLPEPLPLAKGALPPLISAGDDDGDGLDRDEDVCPSEAEDFDGFEDADGCPDLDDDRDGIPDTEDKCRLVGETHNGFEDEDGCPDELPKPLLDRIGRIEGLTFGNNSARILPESEPVLRHLLDVLQRFPSIRVEIAGHTDNKGNRDRNKMLSLLRAESVRAWLVLHGAAGGRIRARGYGPEKPVANNATEKGRAANRRVEFNLVPGDDEEVRRERAADEENKP
ncbi:MAG: OmpA family protein [Deltaproteobacteria bacterium]|nr:OmpA family protein [Deltaproteobacteria bacterium]